MTDEFEDLIATIEGDGPSDDFVASLRALIVQETSSAEPVADAGLPEDITRASNVSVVDQGPKRWTQAMLATAAALIAIAGLAFFGGNDDAQLETSTVPTDAATAIPTTLAPPALGSETAVLDEVAPLAQQYSLVAEGMHRIDQLGTPFAFMADAPLAVRRNSASGFVLRHVASSAENDREIQFMRPTAFSDPTEPSRPLQGFEDGWPVDDFDGWVENLPPSYQASQVLETKVGGRAARQVDLVTGDIVCGSGPSCSYLATNALTFSEELLAGALYRIWVVDQDDEDPLLIVAVTQTGASQDWFETADRLIASLIFGEVAPNPVVVVPVGTADLPLLEGARVTTADDMALVEDAGGYQQIITGARPTGSDYLANPMDRNGNSFTSRKALVEYLEESRVQVERIEDATVGGLNAQVFETSSSFGSASDWSLTGQLTMNGRLNDGWAPTSIGRIWLIQHPDRGLLMVSAWADALAKDEFPQTVAHTEALLGSLEFIDVG